MFFSCHVCIAEWIHTLYLPERQGTSSSKQVWYLKYKCHWTRTDNHLFSKRTLIQLAKLTKWLSWVGSTYLCSGFDCIFLSSHVRVSEWIHTLYLPECQGTSCSKQVRYLKFQWLLLDSNPQPLSCKWTFNYLAKLTKWLSWVGSTCLCGGFDCMFLSSHACVSEWIHTLYLPECQGTSCLKQVQYLKFKWLQLDSNLQPLTL